MQIKIPSLSPSDTWSLLRRTGDDLHIDVIPASSAGRYTGFMLRPKTGSDAFRKLNRHAYEQGWAKAPRRTYAICYHGHFEFMRRLFEAHPDTVIRSSMQLAGAGRTVYDGRDDFYDKAPELGHVNVGSRMMPIDYEDSCECGYCYCYGSKEPPRVSEIVSEAKARACAIA